MSRKHLKREPQYVGGTKEWWFYEDNGGLTVVSPPLRDASGRLQPPAFATRVVTIPWTRIRAALKRKDAK